MRASLVLFLSIVAFVIVGCASKEPAPEAFVQMVLANSSGVSYEYNHLVTLQSISEKATAHCSSEGKKPVLQGTSILKNGNQVASFICQ